MRKEHTVISLNVYLTPKSGQAAKLEHAIKDVWLTAMRQQPGFLGAALITPFSDEDLAKLEASRPAYSYEVVSYWNSEEERVTWVTRDIHQEVWPQVVEQAENVSYTLFNVDSSWNL